ncbi:hypothetical protein I4U23_028638 [Adineta vaga]|nr:hypothetical protein I4U23_028638 [Adineta vaga]
MANNDRIKRHTTERNIASKIFHELERDDEKTEKKYLEQFNLQYGNQTKFTGSNEHKYFLNILYFLIRKRLLVYTKKFIILPTFYCLRILLRDHEFLLIFIQENGLIGLKQQMDLYIDHLTPDLCDSNSEVSGIVSNALADMLKILQKILMNEVKYIERDSLISSRIIESITHLLNQRHFPLLHDTLRLILYMIDKLELYTSEFFKTDIIENLFQLLEYKDLATIQLSLHLLATFFSHPDIRQYIPHVPNDYLYTFTNYLSHNNVKVLEHAIWCLAHCADNENERQKIRLTGAIPLLLSLLESEKRFDFSSPSTTTNRLQSAQSSKHKAQEYIDGNKKSSEYDQLYDMQSACCNCLAELSYDYTNSQTIIERNGIYILAVLLFPKDESLQPLETFIHLQRTVFKTLRFLFPSNEKYDRSQYKRLFPSHIFELFVCIGNFQRDPNAYKEITNAWNSIHIDELNKIKVERLQAMNPKQEPTRFIRDYGVYECLGSGAFGSVYRVAERKSTTMYALKEIKCSLTRDDDRSLESMINEINIIREKLHHRNIVSYFQSFTENGNIYVKMELIVGSSLQEYLTLMKQTNQNMSEDNIWRVFIQLMLALRYLHKEKGIVHRDLTANNIMLDDEYRVKITDFGLAKLRNNDSSKMASAVGTLYYACPEIIQRFNYNEKADIWSLGCVLYYMIVLVLPFYTENILLLAKKICASDYDRTPLSYHSKHLQEVVIECLIIDPILRPDICAIAQSCTEELMSYTDLSCNTIQTLEKRLRQREMNRESYVSKQEYSSVKEPSMSDSSGIADVTFEGTTDEQHETIKQDSCSLSISTKSNNNQHHESTMVPNRSASISFESGYDSNQRSQRFHSSSSTSSIERKSSATSNRSQPSSESGPISIPNSRLRHTDPVSQLLEIVHKIVYISYLPSTSINMKYRRLIDRYRGYLFSKSSFHNLKSELLKLSKNSNDPIEFDAITGRRALNFQSLTKSSSLTNTSNFKTDITILENDGSVTYEQMMSYIDQILLETDYYKDTTISISTGESLPPTVQKNHRPPTRKK